jgi:RNA polymerase sigma-70 factor (ECF subfamily)
MGSLSSATVQSVRRVGLYATPEGLGWVDRLVERARAGDVAAFEQLAERSMPDLFRLAVAMVGEDDARDVTQEALIAAWRELPGLRRIERFDAWLRSIVMNRARNALRTRRRHPTVSLIENHASALVDEPIAAAQRRLDLEAAFGGISVEQREVLVLHYVLDLPLREVANVLGLREGTAKSRLHAGLRGLRSRIPDR